MTGRGGRAGLLLAVATCLAGGALVLWAAGRPWAQGAEVVAGLPVRRTLVTGRTASGEVLSALGVVALAAVAALLATRRLGRRVLGGLLVLVAVGVGAATAAARPAAVALARDAGTTSVATSSWWLAAAGGGVLLAVAGLLSLVAGGGWPVMGRRYDAPARRTDAPGLWEALDRGEDPTDRPG